MAARAARRPRGYHRAPGCRGGPGRRPTRAGPPARSTRRGTQRRAPGGSSRARARDPARAGGIAGFHPASARRSRGARRPGSAGAGIAARGSGDRLDLLQDLGDELTRALVERPPAQASDGDAIRAGYDHELDELKDARDGGKQYIAGLQARERERTGISSLKVGFNKVFGYYLEITNPHRDRVPAD